MVTDEEKARILEFCAFKPHSMEGRNEWLRAFEDRRVVEMAQVLSAVRVARDYDAVVSVPGLVRDGMTRAAARRCTKGLKAIGLIDFEGQSPGLAGSWVPVIVHL